MERCLRGGVPVEAEAEAVLLAPASTSPALSKLRLLKLMLTRTWKMSGVVHEAGLMFLHS